MSRYWPWLPWRYSTCFEFRPQIRPPMSRPSPIITQPHFVAISLKRSPGRFLDKRPYARARDRDIISEPLSGKETQRLQGEEKNLDNQGNYTIAQRFNLAFQRLL